LLIAHLFIWDDKYFGQSLPQLAIDWEDSSAHSQLFPERTPANRGNTHVKTVRQNLSMVFETTVSA